MKLSSYICFGHNKGFEIIRDGPALRINIGFMSIWFAKLDIEELMSNMLSQLKDRDNLVSLVKTREKEATDKEMAILNKIDQYQKQEKTLYEYRERINKLESELTKNVLKGEELHEKINDLKNKIISLEATNDDLVDDNETLKECTLADFIDSRLDLSS